MNRSISILTTLIVLYISYGFYVSQIDLFVVPEDLPTKTTQTLFDYRGLINVHTSSGRGSSSPAEVVSIARSSNLDFLIISDINQFEIGASVEGYHGSLLVIQEGEYSYLDSRVVAVSGTEYLKPRNHGEASLIVADMLSQDKNNNKNLNVSFLHTNNPNYGWTGTLPTGLDSIEILNPKAMAETTWRDSKINILFSLLVYPFNPAYSFLRLFSEPTNETTLWDKANQGSQVLGIAGAEASARAFPLTDYFIHFPSYKSSFSIVSNHLLLSSELTGNYKKDRLKIVSALKKGNYYLSVDLLGDPKGFNAYAEKSGVIYPMGSEISFKSGLKIKASLPRVPTEYYEIVLIRNGERIHTSNEKELEIELTKTGTYRILVRVSPRLPIPDGKKWISWIYSNPFFVTSKPE